MIERSGIQKRKKMRKWHLQRRTGNKQHHNEAVGKKRAKKPNKQTCHTF